MVETRRSTRQAPELAEANGDAFSFDEYEPLHPSTRMNGHAPDPASDSGGNDHLKSGSNVPDTDDEAPDEEVTADARAREQRAESALQAARIERKAERRKRSLAKEVAAAARKRKEAVGTNDKINKDSRFLSDDALERAAVELEEAQEAELEGERAKKLMVQGGTLRVAKTQRVVDGIRVVDASVSASQRMPKSRGSTGQDGMRFLKGCMYGKGTPRVSAEAVTRKVRAARLLRMGGRSRLRGAVAKK
jgi:hypothetical protein